MRRDNLTEKIVEELRIHGQFDSIYELAKHVGLSYTVVRRRIYELARERKVSLIEKETGKKVIRIKVVYRGKRSLLDRLRSLFH